LKIGATERILLGFTDSTIAMRYASVTTKLCSVEQSREPRTHNLLFPRQIPAVSASHGDREFRSRATARERSRPGRACCKALSVELVGRQRQSRAGLSGTFLTEKCECLSQAQPHSQVAGFNFHCSRVISDPCCQYEEKHVLHSPSKWEMPLGACTARCDRVLKISNS
jgi:hypothetical protein